MKKKTVKKLTLAKETVATLLPHVAGGATINCTAQCQSNGNPC
jgi:hypothetical protein